MKLLSNITLRGETTFPAFMAERVYMREFYKKDGLPSDLERWQPTVDNMLDGVDTDGPIYIMIDEAIVSAGASHRREGLHIDGYWNPTLHGHGGHLGTPSGGHGGGGHGYTPAHHSYYYPPEKKAPGVKKKKRRSSWDGADFSTPEGLILASSLSACVGYVGEFDGPIGEGGDCSHIDLSGLDKISMDSHRVYAGNVTALHESIPVEIDCKRQLVRLNVPGWTV